MKINASYRDNVGDRLRSLEYDEEFFNSLTFRQRDGLIMIKTTFEEKPTDYWVIKHYKCSNIENVPVKDRWKFSEAGVKLYTNEKSKDQILNVSLNQTMQSIFDSMLQDPGRRTIKSKIIG
ncbi:PREDICTED: uncharacterized protein LOC107171102 [Diuraphis noxia]|uniref:uncharacterized protein LOC107171102 n=1 Tax=Diuraphis noxia TaxID=143948 RepID=UPI000763B396|nr:PREDICTED: uncharacterized protein LOC107171102 [Diuraphis noxia]